ncbi:Nucleolar Complex 2 protein [Elasticomyces elasticus]|nr:Nucleolar Complex 2 protein [Elasticomyces elasticus]KAK5029218.1 Nucleolar Complex 2 protein [Exophiala sideris]KAK5179009.1 Nucleolar Complex 2 protein [Eurotiomycetes sp. CCFEE 6388]
MGKQAKATKKFEKNSLKSTIERRKDFAKIKQRHQVKEKKKQRAALRTKTTDDEADSDVEDDQPAAIDMNEDEFFREALDIPEDRAETQSKSDGKRKRNTQEGNHLEQSGLDIEGSDDDDVDHKGQLASLAAKDPEFYKYLQENDADLLDFDEDNDLAEVDDLSDEERPAKKQKTKGTEDDASADVTSDMIERWKTSLAKEFSIRALRQVVLAFRAAAHADDEEDKEYKYTIASPEVYHEVLMTALKQVPVVLAHHLPIKESAGGKVRVPTDSPKFKTLAPLIKSHASSLHYLLGRLSDTNTLRLTLQSFEPLLPYLLQFRKFLKVIIKSVASIWSDNSSDKATRITAFLVIRRLMVIGDAGIREAVLKATYEGVVKGSRSTTVHTLAGINLMKNSAAEIWGIDQKVSYTTGFSFIRQLAVHLRGNITKPTKDSYKTIYNWQFVHSLDFWSRVLSTHCDSLVEAQNGKQSQLRPLIYPLVQITLGVMRLIPTSTYFPLRFQLMRSLLRVSQATETYIPLSAALLEVLNSAEMKKPAKAATLRPIDFASNIRAPTSYLKTKVYQEGVGEQVVELFSEFLVLWTKSIAYPELQLPAIVMLKRWLRTASKSTGNRNGKLNQALLLLVQKSEANARWIEERRNKVNFSPKDRAAVEGFLKDVQWQDSPLGAFVVTQRKLREERKKVLDQGRKEQERHNAAQEDSDIEVA